MFRQEQQTVTPQALELPILVPRQRSEQTQCRATGFYRGRLLDKAARWPRRVICGTQMRPQIWYLETELRLVGDEDRDAAKKILGSEDFDLLTGALDLKQGYELDDILLRSRAYQKLRPWLHAKVVGTDIAKKEDYSQLAQDRVWAQLHFPQIVSEKFKDVRLVIFFWPKEKRFTPALFCPDLKTGVFVKSFLQLQTCPYCGRLFVSSKQNQIYCMATHGAAHRMARSRYRKKLQLAQKELRRKEKG